MRRSTLGELGLELKAFENRVGVDVAYYKKNAKDQILKIDVPSATGFKKKDDQRR